MIKVRDFEHRGMIATPFDHGHAYPISCCPCPDGHSILWYQQPMIGRRQAALAHQRAAKNGDASPPVVSFVEHVIIITNSAHTSP